MKKRKWLIPLGIIIGIAVLSVAALWILTARGFGLSVGRCLIAGNGTYMLIEGNSPIVMSNRAGNEGIFDELETGDKILVLHDGVNESYPGGTGVYGIFRLGGGDISDIPEQVLEQLTDLGWLSEDDNQGNEEGGHELVDRQAHKYDAQYIRTNSYHEGTPYPSVKVIHSVEELNTYYEANKGLYDLERKEKVYSDTTIGFLDACDKYDAAYFEEQILILVLLEEGSGSIRHEVTGVETTETSGKQELLIHIERKVPESGTDDMAEWHIFVEPEKDVTVRDEAEILVNLDGKLYSNSGAVTVGENIVAYSYGYANMSISIPEGWEYEVEEYSQTNESFGISFWPVGQTKGRIKLQYTNAFGVCGVGLSEEKITIGEYEAYKGTYDNAKVWDFISLKDTPGSYVFYNEGASAWLGTYMDEAMRIMDTIRVGVGITNREEAIAAAEQKLSGSDITYDTTRASFDYVTGTWTVTFSDKKGNETSVCIP